MSSPPWTRSGRSFRCSRAFWEMVSLLQDLSIGWWVSWHPANNCHSAYVCFCTDRYCLTCQLTFKRNSNILSKWISLDLLEALQFWADPLLLEKGVTLGFCPASVWLWKPLATVWAQSSKDWVVDPEYRCRRCLAFMSTSWRHWQSLEHYCQSFSRASRQESFWFRRTTSPSYFIWTGWEGPGLTQSISARDHSVVPGQRQYISEFTSQACTASDRLSCKSNHQNSLNTSLHKRIASLLFRMWRSLWADLFTTFLHQCQSSCLLQSNDGTLSLFRQTGLKVSCTSCTCTHQFCSFTWPFTRPAEERQTW